MMLELHVFDLGKGVFRLLNTHNYNDDVQIGLVYFRKEAISELEKICTLCGYIAISNDNVKYPIDIQMEKIALFEGTYNRMPILIKKALSKYNIHSSDDTKLSHFFYSWQLEGRFECFEENGPFIELCSIILEEGKYIDSLRNGGKNLFVPSNYCELCEMTRRITDLFQFDFAVEDYEIKYKYLLDSLIHNYHIRFSDSDIDMLWMQICNAVMKYLREGNDGQ